MSSAEIIEASSITTASAAMGLDLFLAGALPSPAIPRRRCIVEASSTAKSGGISLEERRDSDMRVAALPLGAAILTVTDGLSTASSEIMPATVVVLPVPGPPVMMVRRLAAAHSAAAFCSSLRSPWRSPDFATGLSVAISARRRAISCSRRAKRVRANLKEPPGSEWYCSGSAESSLGNGSQAPEDRRVSRHTSAGGSVTDGMSAMPQASKISSPGNARLANFSTSTHVWPSSCSVEASATDRRMHSRDWPSGYSAATVRDSHRASGSSAASGKVGNNSAFIDMSTFWIRLSLYRKAVESSQCLFCCLRASARPAIRAWSGASTAWCLRAARSVHPCAAGTHMSGLGVRY